MAFFILQSAKLVVAILTLTQITYANPHQRKLRNWLTENLNPGDHSFQAEAHCYSLPYGGIGFVSHILTYWTVVWLALGSRPLWPKTKLNQKVLDVFLGLLSLVGSVFFATLTVVRCWDRWQFVLIAVWKTTLSFTLSAVGLHQSFRLVRIKEEVNQSQPGLANLKAAPFWWVAVFGLGTIAGLVGIFSIIAETFHTNPNVRIIVFVFSGIISALGIILAVASRFSNWFSAEGKGIRERGMLLAVFPFEVGLYSTFFLGLLAVFLSDWILSAITGNWSGAPSSDISWLYYSYFVAKRIPIFSL